ncbi:MAG: TIR domain-containing protein [Anaerolineales bacterium]|nr:TIR domain-containing protein [Anaerolineales bacterium]
MTEAKRPLKVFLCHAHSDKDAVKALYTRLTNDGVAAWLDKEKLLPGQDWELEIRKAVRAADVVVVCLSKQFNQAGFRQKEVRLALDTAMEKPEGEIFIIPARLEECDALESLRKWHWVDLFEENGYEMFVRALQTRSDTIGVVLQTQRKTVKSSRNSETEKSKKEIQIKSLQRQAERYEANHEISKALDLYYEIEKIDPFFKGLDRKLTELENKKENSARLIEYISEVFDGKPSEFPALYKNRIIVLGVIFFAMLVLVGIFGLPSLVGKSALNILQSVVFLFVIPVIYLVILWFAFQVVIKSSTIELRIRAMVAGLGGILFALAFIILDVTTTGVAGLSVDATSIYVVIPFGIVSAVIGFFVLFATDLFLRRGASAFVVFFIVWLSLISAYLLIRAPELRGVIALSTVSFLFGNTVYLLVNFSFVKKFFQMASSLEDKTDENRWKL